MVDMTMAQAAHVTNGSLFRPLDWRWRAALAIVQSQRRRQPIPSDPWIQRAVRDLQSADLSSTVCGQALELHQSDPWRRTELQARVLAQQSDGGIAAAMAIRSRVIAGYEALFFDVRDGLAAGDWVMWRAVGQGEAWTDPAVVLRQLAYGGGVAVLEAFLPAFRRSAAGVKKSQIGVDLVDVLFRLWTTPTNNPQARAALAVVGKSVERTLKARSVTNRRKAVIAVLVEHLGSSPKASADPPLADVDSSLPRPRRQAS